MKLTLIVIAAAVFQAGAPAPTEVGVSYIEHVEVSGADPSLPGPPLGLLSDGRDVDLLCRTGKQSLRIDVLDRRTGNPSGRAMLSIGAETFVLDEDARTFSKIPSQQWTVGRATRFDTITRTSGVTGTIDGRSADILMTETRLVLNVPEELQDELSDMPSAVLMRVESWIWQNSDLPLGAPSVWNTLGFSQFLPKGFALREVIKTGSLEIVTSVRDLRAETSDPSLFMIPAGYSRVEIKRVGENEPPSMAKR